MIKILETRDEVQRNREKTDRAAAEKKTSEHHVAQLTEDFVAAKTHPTPQMSETARNLIRVATGKDNEPLAVERAVNELRRFRHEPLVEEFFASRERAAAEKLFADRIAALKRSGLVRAINK